MKRPLIALGFSLAVVVGLVFAFDSFTLAAFSYSALGRGVYAFTASGQVVDGATGKPVPHARVIVKINEAFILATDLHCFGLVADEEGRFSLSRNLPYQITEEMTVGASGPGNLIGFKSYSEGFPRGKTLTNTFTVSLQKPTDLQRKQIHYQYHHFCMNCTPHDNLEFIDEGWDARRW